MPTPTTLLQMAATYSGPGGASAVNVINFQQTQAINQADVDFIAAAWAGFWETLTNEDWTTTGIYRFLDYDGGDPPEELFSADASTNGQGTGNPLPANCAYCIGTSAQASRRGRGRIYIAGLGEADVDDAGSVNGTFQALAISGLSGFATDVATTTGAILAVYSRVDEAVRIVTSISARARIDTQRRRLSRLADA